MPQIRTKMSKSLGFTFDPTFFAPQAPLQSTQAEQQDLVRNTLPMVPRKLLLGLLVVAVLLPMVTVILLGLGTLLSALGDASGAAWVNRIVLGTSVLWCIDLTCLLLVLGINAIDRPS